MTDLGRRAAARSVDALDRPVDGPRVLLVGQGAASAGCSLAISSATDPLGGTGGFGSPGVLPVGSASLAVSASVSSARTRRSMSSLVRWPRFATEPRIHPAIPAMDPLRRQGARWVRPDGGRGRNAVDAERREAVPPVDVTQALVAERVELDTRRRSPATIVAWFRREAPDRRGDGRNPRGPDDVKPV